MLAAAETDDGHTGGSLLLLLLLLGHPELTGKAGQGCCLAPLKGSGACRRVSNGCQAGHSRRCCIGAGSLQGRSRGQMKLLNPVACLGKEHSLYVPPSAACSAAATGTATPTFGNSGGSFAGGSAAGLGGAPTAAARAIAAAAKD